LLSNAERIIEERFRAVFEKFRAYQEHLFRSFDRIGVAIERMKDTLVESERRIVREFTDALEKKNDMFVQFEKLLMGQNPERQLRLGWSITKNKAGKVVRSVSQVKSGEELEVSLADGSLNVKIK
jgi:exodeoxyribonuclease VII large subunit